jgi:hypothetical protein
MLIGISPIAKTCTQAWHLLHTKNQTNYTQLELSQPNPQLIMWKVHAAHDCEQDYHDSLHSAEVAQLYPQVGDFVTRRWLRVSILPNVHFLRCTARRSPHSLSQRFPAHKIFTLRFHRSRSRFLQSPPLVSRLGDKPTPSHKSRKSHPVPLPQISTKLGKQHVT